MGLECQLKSRYQSNESSLKSVSNLGPQESPVVQSAKSAFTKKRDFKCSTKCSVSTFETTTENPESKRSSFVGKRDSQPTKVKTRKTSEQRAVLIYYYQFYEGHWDEQIFLEVVALTGFNKWQVNKWFYDRRKKEETN